MSDHLPSPHGGVLVDLLAGEERRLELRELSSGWPSWSLDARQRADLEMLLCGAYSPLRGYPGEAELASIRRDMRLADGTLWPLPLTLQVSEEAAASLEPGASLALRDPEGVMLAALEVEEIFRPSGEGGSHPVALAGPVEGVQMPHHYDFRDLRPTPSELRARFGRLGWRRVLACQSSEPFHRAEVELCLGLAQEAGANLLLHPAVGLAESTELGHYTRVRCFQAVLENFPPHTAELALLPLAPDGGGLRRGLLGALVAKNYGCSHLLLEGPRADTGAVSPDAGREGPAEVAAEIEELGAEVGVAPLAGSRRVYVQGLDAHLPADQVPPERRGRDLSAEELRSLLDEGREVPPWYSFPEVVRELRRAYPPADRTGFTVFFTGLSGAGKSTVANVLLVRLLEMGGRPVTLLDGDIVRRHLSSELGFSKEHRDINIRRIGFVASEITKNGGIALCAPIAPYDSVRREVRRMVEARGGFVLVHVATPLDVCESRDRKGLYAKARAGIIKEFTGVSDPYEVPGDADLHLDTANLSPEEAAQEVVLYLERRGYIGAKR